MTYKAILNTRETLQSHPNAVFRQLVIEPVDDSSSSKAEVVAKDPRQQQPEEQEKKETDLMEQPLEGIGQEAASSPQRQTYIDHEKLMEMYEAAVRDTNKIDQNQLLATILGLLIDIKDRENSGGGAGKKIN